MTENVRSFLLTIGDRNKLRLVSVIIITITVVTAVQNQEEKGQPASVVARVILRPALAESHDLLREE